MPMVLIDQDADPEATIVQLSFGDRLGALIDTVSDSIACFSFFSSQSCHCNKEASYINDARSSVRR